MSIIHIDGDSFFASVEQACNPALRGKPVVTGRERGIVTAASREAKEQGVTRGMPAWEVRKVCPGVVITSSDYRLYTIFSQRMFAIARRFCDEVEEYSIDEFFARVTNKPAEDTELIAWRVKQAIQRELGVTVSVGVAPTKVLAKIASNHEKPDGFVSLLGKDTRRLLARLRLDGVWGIGPRTALRLVRERVYSAADFATQSWSWVAEHTAKPYHEIWHELHGRSVIPFGDERRITARSIRASRTFAPTTEQATIRSELSRNVERACRKARRKGYAARRAVVYLKTQEFAYHRRDVPLPSATAFPHLLLDWIAPAFAVLYQSGVEYRATGIVLADLASTSDAVQPDLFGGQGTSDSYTPLYRTLDRLTRRFGKETVTFCSTLGRSSSHGATKRHAQVVFYLPSLGDVS